MRFLHRPWSFPFTAPSFILLWAEPAICIPHHPAENTLKTQSWPEKLQDLRSHCGFLCSHEALELDSNNEKGLFRWREAHLAMNDVDSAQADFQKSCSSTPAAKPPWPSWLSAIIGSTSSSLQEKQLCNCPKVKLQHPSSRTPT